MNQSISVQCQNKDLYGQADNNIAGHIVWDDEGKALVTPAQALALLTSKIASPCDPEGIALIDAHVAALKDAPVVKEEEKPAPSSRRMVRITVPSLANETSNVQGGRVSFDALGRATVPEEMAARFDKHEDFKVEPVEVAPKPTAKPEPATVTAHSDNLKVITVVVPAYTPEAVNEPEPAKSTRKRAPRTVTASARAR